MNSQRFLTRSTKVQPRKNWQTGNQRFLTGLQHPSKISSIKWQEMNVNGDENRMTDTRQAYMVLTNNIDPSCCQLRITFPQHSLICYAERNWASYRGIGYMLTSWCCGVHICWDCQSHTWYCKGLMIF